jgi:DNA-binding MarR family transcriptional regulator
VDLREPVSQRNNRLETEIRRFLDAWLGARQIIQAANFNRFQKAGLSATQFMTLNLLPVDGTGLTLSELAKRMNLGLATLAKTVDSLQSRGMLTRTRSDSDRRSVTIALTEAGKALQNAASKEFQDHMGELFRGMTAKQRAGLIEGLESLVGANAKQVGTGPGRANGAVGDGPPERRSSR